MYTVYNTYEFDTIVDLDTRLNLTQANGEKVINIGYVTSATGLKIYLTLSKQENDPPE